jgi:hypothetical protein
MGPHQNSVSGCIDKRRWSDLQTGAHNIVFRQCYVNNTLFRIMAQRSNPCMSCVSMFCALLPDLPSEFGVVCKLGRITGHHKGFVIV